MELTAEQIQKHIKKFNPIYHDGKEINPIPDGVKVTVWCKSRDEEGFISNVRKDEMGIELFIAKKWILEDDLQSLHALNAL